MVITAMWCLRAMQISIITIPTTDNRKGKFHESEELGWGEKVEVRKRGYLVNISRKWGVASLTIHITFRVSTCS